VQSQVNLSHTVHDYYKADHIIKSFAVSQLSRYPMPEQLTLYSAKICPFAHRVELALEEAKADYTRFEIDLKNKPDWYAPKVNPASKVPAVAYGGPTVSPDHPSEDSQKIAESLVLIEFVADLYPDSPLLPKDPVLRAKARFFIDTVSTKFIPGYIGSLARGQPFEGVFAGVEAIQSLLPPEGKGKYAVGDEFTVADAAILPFIARMEVSFANDIGSYPQGEGKKAYAVLETDPKYARFRQYFSDLKERESFKKTFDEQYIKTVYDARFSPLRAQAQAA